MSEKSTSVKPLLPASSIRPVSQIRRKSDLQDLVIEISRSLSLSTILLLGGVLQGTVLLLVPRIWALLPAILVLLIRFADALAVAFRFRKNPYLEGTLSQHFTVNIPDADGKISPEPASEKVAVLLLCAKSNHPMGSFAQYFKEVGDFSTKMAVELDKGAEHNGFLGQSDWSHVDENGLSEIMLLSYWRSIEDIHKYAEGPLHVEAVKWWDSVIRKDKAGLRHIGIDHEIFEAPRRRWEKISVNFQPTRLGATTYLRKGDKLIGGTVEDQWISPVIAAKGRYKTSRGRLGHENVDQLGVWSDRPLFTST